jgi:hypothetical protein
MDVKIRKDILDKRWTHSHEEDTDTERVYRPDTYSFPPSRGRESFELKSDGSLVHGRIAPTDARRDVPGSWELRDDDTLALSSGSARIPSRVMRIISADKDRLVIKK